MFLLQNIVRHVNPVSQDVFRNVSVRCLVASHMLHTSGTAASATSGNSNEQPRNETSSDITPSTATPYGSVRNYHVDLGANKTGSEFGKAQVVTPHPVTLEPSSFRGSGSSGNRFKSSASNSHYGSSHINLKVAAPAVGDLEQIAIPDYSDPYPVAFRGLETDFPCLSTKRETGPEPEYQFVDSGYNLFSSGQPFKMSINEGVLPELHVAYETWGQLNEDASNAVLVFCGLSASSHLRSHQDNPSPGWWEKFVGPGCAIDTNKYFVICANNLGGCYGTSGPSSENPITGKPYGTSFPIFTVEDIIRSQFLLLDHLNIDKLYASVGASLGGMLSMAASVLYPHRVNRVVSISACIRSHPTSIAMRYLQRKSIMTDPNWQKGYYYGTGKYPKAGMKLAREIATLTYRSGPEWEERFGRKRISKDEGPSLCPTFLIENYLDYQGESAATKLDPNTLLYISKAMDLYDMGETYGSLHAALSRVTCPVMVIGVQTDILFPIWQQREIANVLQETDNHAVTYFELNSIYGHDTFLLDLSGVGSGIKGFLDTQMMETGRVRKRQDKE